MSGRFRPGWRMSVFVLVLLPVLLALGIWQLRRAEEKRGIEADYYTRLAAPPRPASGVEPERLAPFTRLGLTGRYDGARQFLVDNRMHEGRVGYTVVTPFTDRSGRTWLVNRGWIPGGASRRSLPDAPVPRTRVDLVAVAWPDLGLPPLLAEDVWRASWPKRVQRLNVERMAASLGGAVAWELRLEAGNPGALTDAGSGVDFAPERHTGYAVQWFALAVVLVAAYVVLGLRGGRK